MTKRTKLPIYSKNRDNINWNIPSLFHYDEIIFTLMDLLEEFNIKSTIKSVYGCVKSNWAGGKPSGWKEIDCTTAEKYIAKYNKHKISCCFTFSSNRITDADLDDKIGNLLLDAANNSSFQNYAIVSSDILADYIRKKYPNIKLISSVLKPIFEKSNCQETPEYYNELCTKFDRVRIRPEFAFDNNFLKKLKDKKKIELIANSICIPNCPLTQRHADFFLDVEAGLKPIEENFCNIEKRQNNSIFKTSHLSNEDIDRLIKLGFHNFKINGRRLIRTDLLEVLGTYVFEPTGLFYNLKNKIMSIIQQQEILNEQTRNI